MEKIEIIRKIESVKAEIFALGLKRRNLENAVENRKRAYTAEELKKDEELENEMVKLNEELNKLYDLLPKKDENTEVRE